MAVEIKQVLSDMNFFKNHINEIYFEKADGGVFGGFPSVAEWSTGQIVLGMNGTEATRELLITHLQKYDIKAEMQEKGYTINKHVIVFNAKSTDDIIPVLHHALEYRKVEQQSLKSDELVGRVDLLVEHQPKVKHGLLSRGVKDMQAQIDMLARIREKQKENGY